MYVNKFINVYFYAVMFKAITKLFTFEKKAQSSTALAKHASDPAEAASLFQQAGELLDQGKVAVAIELYSQVIQIDPHFEKALVMLGFLQKQSGDLRQAKVYLQRALDINPQLADANYLLGSIAAAENDAEKMAEYFQRSLQLDPMQEHIYLEFSYALFQLGRGKEAVAQISQGLEKFPNHVGMLQYLGNFQLNQHHHQEAFDAYEKALMVMPDSVDLRYNFVICCMTLFKYDEALDSLMRIQRVQPDHIMANFEEGMLRLQRGEYERGWKQFEWRWKTQALVGSQFKTPKPKWNGTQSLAGKTILVRSEQGFGDTIQFSRFVPQLENLGAKVVFSTSPRLIELMQQIPGVASLIDEGKALPDFDFYCELMSLPTALGISLQNLPLAAGYLSCPIVAKTYWQTRVQNQGQGRKIGIVWSGNPLHTNNHMRSISLASIKSIFDLDADFTVLQKELSSEELVELSQYPHVYYYGDEVDSFSDTAALIEQMDLVITVDTSVAHLSGAMGKATWILVSCFSDWRWLLNTETSPWYDSVRLFRQHPGEPWEIIINTVKEKLLESN